MPYIEILADYWGELCVTQEIADAWADQLLDITRMALSPDKTLRGHFHGTTACLSALLHARRFKDIHALLAHTDFWHYKCYAVRALAAEGRHDEAISLAESLRGPWTPDGAVNRLCEQILLKANRIEEAYRRFGLAAHAGGTYLATFRAVAKAYPSIARERILRDLVQQSPGDEGKWFTAAKELGMYELALELVRDSPCDPKTLTRAAGAYAARQPAFAEGAGLAALRWLVQGFGYESQRWMSGAPSTRASKPRLLSAVLRKPCPPYAASSLRSSPADLFAKFWAASWVCEHRRWNLQLHARGRHLSGELTRVASADLRMISAWRRAGSWSDRFVRHRDSRFCIYGDRYS